MPKIGALISNKCSRIERISSKHSHRLDHNSTDSAPICRQISTRLDRAKSISIRSSNHYWHSFDRRKIDWQKCEKNTSECLIIHNLYQSYGDVTFCLFQRSEWRCDWTNEIARANNRRSRGKQSNKVWYNKYYLCDCRKWNKVWKRELQILQTEVWIMQIYSLNE